MQWLQVDKKAVNNQIQALLFIGVTCFVGLLCCLLGWTAERGVIKKREALNSFSHYDFSPLNSHSPLGFILTPAYPT